MKVQTEGQRGRQRGKGREEGKEGRAERKAEREGQRGKGEGGQGGVVVAFPLLLTWVFWPEMVNFPVQC